MRTHFDECLNECSKDESKYDHDMSIELTMYMSLWYGMLYVVIEGWRKMNLKDAQVDLFLKNKNVERLKDYRNGTFHFHERYWNRKIKPFLTEQTSADWVRKLNLEFGRYFLKVLK
jgi:hypothetical protein